MPKFTARFKEGVYNQLKKYAEENEMSIMAVLRFIVKQFFKK